MEKVRICGACRHWLAFGNFAPGALGTCKLYPPTPLPEDRQALPLMHKSDWCGQWGAIVSGVDEPPPVVEDRELAARREQVLDTARKAASGGVILRGPLTENQEGKK